MLGNGPISVEVGLQGLTAQSAMEAELVAAALTMKEVVFCKNMMEEPRFKDGFSTPRILLSSRIYLEHTWYTTMPEKPTAVLEP